MRESDFWRLVAEEFGEGGGRRLAAEAALGEFGDRTAVEALAAGQPARRVWWALCDLMDVPEERRLGRILPKMRENEI